MGVGEEEEGEERDWVSSVLEVFSCLSLEYISCIFKYSSFNASNSLFAFWGVLIELGREGEGEEYGTIIIKELSPPSPPSLSVDVMEEGEEEVEEGEEEVEEEEGGGFLSLERVKKRRRGEEGRVEGERERKEE